MIETDDRLCSIAGIDKTRAALVSATSLMTMSRVLQDNQIPNDDSALVPPFAIPNQNRRSATAARRFFLGAGGLQPRRITFDRIKADFCAWSKCRAEHSFPLMISAGAKIPH